MSMNRTLPARLRVGAARGTVNEPARGGDIAARVQAAMGRWSGVLWTAALPGLILA